MNWMEIFLGASGWIFAIVLLIEHFSKGISKIKQKRQGKKQTYYQLVSELQRLKDLLKRGHRADSLSSLHPLIENSFLSKKDREKLKKIENLRCELKEEESEISENMLWRINREVEKMEELNTQWKYLIKQGKVSGSISGFLHDQRMAIINGSFELSHLKEIMLNLLGRDCGAYYSHPAQRGGTSDELDERLAKILKGSKHITLRELLEGEQFFKLVKNIKTLEDKPSIKTVRAERKNFLDHIDEFLSQIKR